MHMRKSLAVLIVLVLSLVLIILSTALASAVLMNSAPSLSVITNAPSVVPVAGPLAPALELLPASFQPVLMKIIVWIGSFGLVLAPFSVWIQMRLTDLLNTAAASQAVDDDLWLRNLFTHPAYRFVATLLRFAHVRLPTIADLERALQLQSEAVKKPL